MYIFDVVKFFTRLVVIQSTRFLEAVLFYKIDIFDEAFFLLFTRIPMTTKIFRIVTCGEELSPINIHETSME